MGQRRPRRGAQRRIVGIELTGHDQRKATSTPTDASKSGSPHEAKSWAVAKVGRGVA
jgi:hypothetical protein